MARLGHDCKNAGEPIITALIVDKETGRCSQGLFDEFHIDDDDLERQRCYAYWGKDNAESADGVVPTGAVESKSEQPSLEERVARFTAVEVRTEQRAFREAVFRACGGCCVVSGCDVPEALEAAHLLGRDWRQGQNAATDGMLLRRDLHTLYDRGLLRITESGHIELAPGVLTYYAELQGKQLAPNGSNLTHPQEQL